VQNEKRLPSVIYDDFWDSLFFMLKQGHPRNNTGLALLSLCPAHPCSKKIHLDSPLGEDLKLPKGREE
ncbi:hypothetical protein ACFFK0_23675, partial [Paenibacillus chartarius]